MMKAAFVVIVCTLLAGCLEARPGAWNHPALADVYRKAVMGPTNVKGAVRRNMHLAHSIVNSLSRRGMVARQTAVDNPVCDELADLVLQARDLVLEMWPEYLKPRFAEIGGEAEAYANQYITILPHLNKEIISSQVCIVAAIGTEEQLAQVMGISVAEFQAALVEVRPVLKLHISKALINSAIDGVLTAEARLYNALHDNGLQVTSVDLIPTLTSYFTLDEMKELIQGLFNDLRPILQFAMADVMETYGGIPDEQLTLISSVILNTQSLSQLSSILGVELKYVQDVDEALKVFASAPPELLELEQTIGAIFKKILNDTKIYDIIVNGSA